MKIGFRIRIVAVLAFASSMFFQTTSEAIAQTWKSSPTDSNWGNATNWTSGLAPISGVSTSLNFNSSSITALNNNLTAGFGLNAITFSSTASAYSISGNSLTFQGTAPQIQNSSTNSISFANEMILNSDLTLNTTNTGTLTLTGVISGTGGITKTGTGTATVNGISTTLNSFTGETSVSQGTLILQTNHNASNSFAWASSVFNINGASILQIGGKRFDFGGWSPTKSINFDSTGGGTLHLTVNGLGGFQNTGNLSINTNGGSQNLITSASSQGLNLGGSGSKLTFNVVQGSNTTSDLNISTAIFNSGSIIKSGSGTLELSTNSNSMSGTTTINGGKLLVSNTSGSATGSGAVIVANGGTLTGGGTTAGASGKISGNVTVQSGGQIAPGNGTSVPGIINLGGNLTLNSGATASFQFNSASPGTGYSQINMTGGGSLNLGNSILEVKLAAGFTPSQSDVFTIINSGPGISVFSNVVTDGNGRTYVSVYGIGEFDVTYGATSVQLSNYVVPEPTTLMTLGAAGLGLFHFARRRLRKASRVGEGEQQGTQAV